MIRCTTCGSTDYRMEKDKRGLPHAYCNDCNAHIKNMSTAEVVEYYDSAETPPAPTVEEPTPEKPPCKFCTERYVMEQGHPSTRIIRVPIEPNYCPMCGRKLK